MRMVRPRFWLMALSFGIIMGISIARMARLLFGLMGVNFGILMVNFIVMTVVPPLFGLMVIRNGVAMENFTERMAQQGYWQMVVSFGIETGSVTVRMGRRWCGMTGQRNIGNMAAG